MNRSGWHEQGIASLDPHTLAGNHVFPRPFEHVDDLFAGMRVVWKRDAWREIDAHLDDLASRRAQIVALELRTADSSLPSANRVQRCGASRDEHHDGDDSNR